MLTIAALALDWVIGDPQSWPHPVRFIGHLIVALERFCLRVADWLKGGKVIKFLLGVFLALGTIGVSVLAIGYVLSLAFRLSGLLWLACALYLVFTIFCLKDLIDHVNKVEKALEALDLDKARRALSWIVGRDTAHLSPEGIRRATIETVAENFSDGLVAPLLYLALGGPVLAWGYKAVNTLDSMVGYKNERYLYLGRFSARLDDAANFIPARLAALLLILGAKILRYDSHNSYALWRREGAFHSSPNSGQTEAAMAGALNVHLGGPNYYGGILVEKPAIGAGGQESTRESVQKALKLVKFSTLLAIALAILIEAMVLAFFQYPWGWGLSF
ncbi:MAG: adenosylcobinamide-phosphate synthase CbiB [Deltaproteobacteria bacterium]|jgi:adenosylcobinamide-phosphate synthase|nr:adenosylcobinamide-phosphate synthase CbiB [Deltaproteobacteria bacterium]